jgi:diketogulonate reductase-like aldo/keto reductase
MGHSIFGSFRGRKDNNDVPNSNDTIKMLSNYYNKSPEQIIIQWNVQNNIIVIPRSSNKKRMEENFNINTFSIEDKHMEDINNINRNSRQCNPRWLPNKTKIYDE